MNPNLVLSEAALASAIEEIRRFDVNKEQIFSVVPTKLIVPKYSDETAAEYARRVEACQQLLARSLKEMQP